MKLPTLKKSRKYRQNLKRKSLKTKMKYPKKLKNLTNPNKQKIYFYVLVVFEKPGGVSKYSKSLLQDIEKVIYSIPNYCTN